MKALYRYLLRRWRIVLALLVLHAVIAVLLTQFVTLLPYSPYVVLDPIPRGYEENAEAPGGKLERLQGLPIATFWGDAGALGEAHGRLLGEQVRILVNAYLPRYFELDEARLQHARETAKTFEASLPHDVLAEMHALADAAEVSYDDILLANSFLDLDPSALCSTFFVGAGRTQQTVPLLGRTLDFPAYGLAGRYDLLLHVRKSGKVPFVAIGWPGMVGVVSGMNAAGLAVTMNISYTGNQIPGGYPVTLLVRRILEEAETLDAALQILGNNGPASSINLTMVDRRGRATIGEVSPNFTRFRYPVQDALYATNYFVSKSWKNRKEDERFLHLRQSAKSTSTSLLTLEDMQAVLAGVHLDRLTLQAMIFEPVTKKLYLSMESRPATDGPYKTIDLKALFGRYKSSREF